MNSGSLLANTTRSETGTENIRNFLCNKYIFFILTQLFFFFSSSFQSKNLFSAFRTPAVLFVLVCLLYVLSALLLFVGLSSISFACDCMLGLAMVAMLTWGFIRYSGQYRNVGTAIDQAAGLVLEQVWRI